MTGPTRYQLVILRALQSMQIYHGTVTEKVKARRRAKNRVARVSRRANR